MPQRNNRLIRIVVLPAVAILSCILLVALVVYWTRDVSHGDLTVGSRVTSTLRLVIVVTRHGNRSPIFTYPSSPYRSNNTVYWPNGPRQLTTKGRIQMYRLGEKFRSMYNTFLNDKYKQEDFYASSSAKDRTLMSAQLFVAGLFPPKDYQVWNNNLLWQPVPIYTNNLDHTEYLIKGEECPRFKQIQKDTYGKFKEDNKAELAALYEYASIYTGTKNNHLTILYDSIICAEREGFPIPSWTSKVYPKPMKDLMQKFDHSISSATIEMMRLVEGELYQEMVRLMEAKADDSLKPGRKMHLYSGHDFTIGVLAKILDVDLGFVSMGSALVLELHKSPKSTKYHVEVLYIDGASADLEPLTLSIHGCGTQCPLDVLLEVTKKYYNITDHYKECHELKNDGETNEEGDLNSDLNGIIQF